MDMKELKKGMSVKFKNGDEATLKAIGNTNFEHDWHANFENYRLDYMRYTQDGRQAGLGMIEGYKLDNEKEFFCIHIPMPEGQDDFSIISFGFPS